MPALIIESGPGAGTRFEVVGAIVAGRGKVDFVIDDPELSRRHIAVRVAAAGIEIEDLGSLNGTWQGGQRLDGPTVIPDGAVIRVGATELRVDLSSPDAAEPPPVGVPPPAVVGVEPPVVVAAEVPLVVEVEPPPAVVPEPAVGPAPIVAASEHTAVAPAVPAAAPASAAAAPASAAEPPASAATAPASAAPDERPAAAARRRPRAAAPPRRSPATLLAVMVIVLIAAGLLVYLLAR